MPAMGPLPPGGDQNIGNRLVILQSVLISIATTFIALRLYVRTRITHALGLDDFFIVLALLLGWVLFALGIIAVNFGQGRHAYYLSKDQLMNFGRIVYIALPITVIATACSRLSIALFLLHIVNPGRKWRHGLWAVCAFITLNYVAIFIAGYFKCIPFQKLWRPTIPGSCWPEAALAGFTIWEGIFSIICDFVLALLPVIFLWDVRITLRRKISICVLMGFGVVTGICAIVRTILAAGPIVSRSDPTWNNMNTAAWAAAEELLLLVAASIPTIQPLFKRSQYRRGYVPPQKGSGETKLKPLKPSRDPYPVDYHTTISSSTKSRGSIPKSRTASEHGSEIRLHGIHAAENNIV